MGSKTEMTKADRDQLLSTLRDRFESNMQRHADISWDTVVSRLASNPGKLLSLQEMESSGGAPDVVGIDHETGGLLFFDCSAESPIGRRSLCYDAEALAARKANKPTGSVVEMAKSMGVALLTEVQYRYLQQLGDFDKKTSSWVHTPEAIRKKGGAVFCDCRYDHVFYYHNGADSYYAARGFRGCVKI